MMELTKSVIYTRIKPMITKYLLEIFLHKLRLKQTKRRPFPYTFRSTYPTNYQSTGYPAAYHEYTPSKPPYDRETLCQSQRG